MRLEIFNADKISDRLWKEFTKELLLIGFVEEDVLHHGGILYRYFDGGYDITSSTHIQYDYAYGLFFKSEYLEKRFDVVEDIWEDLQPSMEIHQLKNRGTIRLSMERCYPEVRFEPNYDKNRRGIGSEATLKGVKQYMEVVRVIIHDKMLPVLDKYSDLREIDKVVNFSLEFTQENSGFLGGDGSAFRRLIIAKLVGNPLYEDIYLYHKNLTENYIKSLQGELDDFNKSRIGALHTVYERLKDVKPLENTVFRYNAER